MYLCVIIIAFIIIIIIFITIQSLSKGDIWRPTLYKTLPKIKDGKIKSRI